jgi:hypothetical protein
VPEQLQPEQVQPQLSPRPIWLKYLRLCAGFLVLAAGIVLSLPLVPGPGIPLILFGLLLLSDHFVWARKTLEWARKKWH